MSRATDIATVLSVISKVVTKNAILRRVASENKWKTSSVLRNVGQERHHDTFYTEDDMRDSEPSAKPDDASTTSYTPKQKDSPVFQSATAPTAGQVTSTSYEPQILQSKHTDFTESLGTDPADNDAMADDIFYLRQARSVSKLSSKVSKDDSRLDRTFRANKDFLRPTLSDRFDIRSTPKSIVTEEPQIVQKLTTGMPTPSPPTDVVQPIAVKDANQKENRNKSHSEQSPLGSTSKEPRIDQITEDETFTSPPRSTLSSSAVPSSRISRLYHYTTLGMSLAYNVAADSTKTLLNGPSEGETRGLLSSKNTDQIVKKLSRMRGAALKLGQMISFQAENLPGPIQQVLQRVQDSADYMPPHQLNNVMQNEFGSEWRNLFAEFDDVPIAAASIGQVHKATLPDGRQVAVKVQYPGVANSISSDLRNMSLLLTASRLLPKGLYLDKTIENARTELAWECDYVREAENTRRFRQLVGESDVFTIPEVIDHCSGKQVLTTVFLEGTGIAKSQSYPQDLRDFLGSEIMRLCLRELAEFRFMQTDPNWTNFLYNKHTNKIELLDFGACRSFDESFIRKYCELLVAAANGDRAELQRLSTELGYLTGSESSTMINAHISSILTLSEPFSFSDPSDLYSFENQTVTDRVKSFIPVMLRERLAPPPEETYSLHRRLSGHFLLCARLRSRVPCKAIFKDVMTKAGYLREPTA